MRYINRQHSQWTVSTKTHQYSELGTQRGMLGRYAGKKSRSGVARVAHCRVTNGPGGGAGGPKLAVPVEHLWPVQPEKVDEDVLMLHGTYKGSLAKVYAIEGGSNVLVRTIPALVVVDMTPETLVRRWELDGDGNRVEGA